MTMLAFLLGALLAQVAPLPTNPPNAGTAPPVMEVLPRHAPPPALVARNGKALIVNSGSTNTAAYRILLSPDGAAAYAVRDGGVRQSRVDRSVAQNFFARLKGAGALNALPTVACAKSASFGFVLTVTYRGARSGDLTCARDAAGRRLADAAAAVAGSLNLAPGPRSVHLLH